MEAVSAAASIAGLLSVAGHVLTGLVKLNAFIQDAKEAGTRAQRLTKETDIFCTTLVDFNSLLNTLDEKVVASNQSFLLPHCDRSRSRLEECLQYLDAWTVSQQSEDEKSSKRRVIIDGTQNKSIREMLELEAKLSHHRSQVGLDMGAINIGLSLGGLDRITGVGEAVEKLANGILRIQKQGVSHSKTIQESTRELLHFEDTNRTTSYSYHKQLLPEHHDTRSQLSEMSDNMSSIAEFLRKLARLPKPQVRGRGSETSFTTEDTKPFRITLKKAKSTTNMAFSEVGWTCAGAIGIDDYFIGSREDRRLGRMRCALCNQMFGNSESLERSKHMVNIHKFATCDQGARYRYRDSFESHLRGYHAADTDAVSANILGMKEIFHRHKSEVEDVRIESLHSMQQHLESSTASLILGSQLRSLMSGFFHASKLPSSNGLNTLNDLRGSLEMLSDVVFSSRSTLESAAILYQAANLVEELSVSFDRTSGSRWTSIPSALLEKVPQAKEAMTAGRPPQTSDIPRSSPAGFCPLIPE
ncbi:hypothetical protein CMEL01_09359 [Colletotrichum melonis]|uniref:Fungal N-terminal domain-containing protein n=1 Tax=Colletotrichum melonis TaxID=1209925 RepID=A0AAI9TX11_9PEZI|nr:hypothetical protein CMEL01_09359 [Colletotrichum melonis]